MKARLVKFGEIEVEGKRYTHDVVIDGGKVRKRKKGPSKQFREKFGHTPLSAGEEIPWGGKRLIVGTGAHGALPVMDEGLAEAKRREYDCAVVANRFDRATFHRFFAERFLLRGLWLLVNVGMTPVVVAFETGRCRFATQIAIDALIIDVECPRYVFGVFVCDVGHSFYGKSEIQH